MPTQNAWFVTARVMEVVDILNVRHEKNLSGIIHEAIVDVVGSEFEKMTPTEAYKIMLKFVKMFLEKELSNSLYEGVYFALTESHVNLWGDMITRGASIEAQFSPSDKHNKNLQLEAPATYYPIRQDHVEAPPKM